MSKNMIERIAGAIKNAMGLDGVYTEHEELLAYARAAIEAMLGEIAYIIDGRGVTHKNFKIVYKSDAALNQTDSEDGK
jgi:hypothetical protein